MAKLLAFTPKFTVSVIQDVPELDPGEVHRATTTTRIPGGHGVDVAHTVRLLGHEAALGGFLGQVNGRFVQRNLERQGWTIHAVWCDGEIDTTMLVQESDGRSTIVTEQPMPVAPEQVDAFAELVVGLRDQFDWISLSGNLPPGAPADSYVAVCKAARPAKIAIAVYGDNLDVLTHQNADLFWLDQDHAAGMQGREVRSPAEARSACLELQRWGNQRVCILMDGRTAVGTDGNQCWQAILPDQVDSHGGDAASAAAFGAMLAALMDGQAFEAALGSGIAAACCASSDDPGLYPAAFETLLPLVRIEVLA